MVSTPPDLRDSARQYLHSDAADLDSRSPNQSIFPLTARINEGDRLEIGGCDVITLVERFGSPLYILDEATLRAACRHYTRAFETHYGGEFQILYASKAWSAAAVCAIVASEGLGIDVVSGGELYAALRAGVPGDRIYFHGNNKSVEELQAGLEAGVTFVIDNWLELETLGSLAHGRNHPVSVAVRLTPGIECHTHEYIRTGHLDSKFGFDPDRLPEVFEFLRSHPQLECHSLHAHIGSQIFERQPHNDLGQTLVGWWQKATASGLEIRELNVGGGLGIRYVESDDPPSIGEWVQTVCAGVTKACEAANLPLPKLLCEPGRSLIGPACVTAYTVGARKTVPGIRTYLSVDGGMSDNPRPITYQSQYRAAIANRMSAPFAETVTVAGKHCESGDVLIENAPLPKAETDDILVVAATGAYNASMASNYNRIPRPATVLVEGGDANIIVRRETHADLLRNEYLPDRLNPDADATPTEGAQG